VIEFQGDLYLVFSYEGTFIGAFDKDAMEDFEDVFDDESDDVNHEVTL
jgi:hypothetical protein